MSGHKQDRDFQSNSNFFINKKGERRSERLANRKNERKAKQNAKRKQIIKSKNKSNNENTTNADTVDNNTNNNDNNGINNNNIGQREENRFKSLIVDISDSDSDDETADLSDFDINFTHNKQINHKNTQNNENNANNENNQKNGQNSNQNNPNAVTNDSENKQNSSDIITENNDENNENNNQNNEENIQNNNENENKIENNENNNENNNESNNENNDSDNESESDSSSDFMEIVSAPPRMSPLQHTQQQNKHSNRISNHSHNSNNLQIISTNNLNNNNNSNNSSTSVPKTVSIGKYRNKSVKIYNISHHSQCLACVTRTTLVNISSECDHEPQYCLDCIRRTIESEISQKGNCHFTCKAVGCEIEFDTNDFYPILSSRKLEIVDKIITHRCLEKIASFRWCKNKKGCGNGQLISNWQNLRSYYVCHKCKTKLCFQHEIEWHRGFTCEEYQRELNKNKEFGSQEMLASFTKRCPNDKCGMKISKLAGCDVMCCCQYGTHGCKRNQKRLKEGCDHGGRQFCGQLFCWKCLGKIEIDQRTGGYRRHCKASCEYANLN